MDAILYAALGFFIGAALVGGVLFRRVMRLEREKTEIGARITAQEHVDNQFKVSAQEAMKAAHESFLELAEAKLKAAQKDGTHDLEKRQKAIDEMVKPVQDHLKALSGALEQVKGTDKALREDLQSLSRETARLVGALRDPSAQGQWGEFILEGLLEKSGLMKGVHYETQVTMDTASGKQRPDAVIHMQDGFNIIIDSKAPINQFTQRLGEDLSEDDHNALVQSLARQVRDHVKKLGQKGYWENIESVDFTVMFLPSEHIYSMALRADPELVNYAAERDVIITSPTLLMSLLRVVGMSWRQVELAKNAQEISERGVELYKRLLVFTDHIESVGKNLQRAMSGYDSAVGSLQKSVLPAARKFKELQAASGLQDVPDLKIIEQNPRALDLTAEDEDEKRRA